MSLIRFLQSDWATSFEEAASPFAARPYRLCAMESWFMSKAEAFYDFLELVLKPLQRYLKERQLAPVTVASIVRLVTDDFPPSS